MKKGWISWGILVFCFFLAFVHRTAPGTIKGDLIATFALSGTSFGLMSSMYFYAYMLMQIPVGLLADSWGARKTVSVGMFMGSFATLLFGLATEPYLLFIGRFFVGIGMAMIFVCMLKIQSQWFTGAMFGTLSGIAIFFGNLGGAAGQTPLALLVEFFGWRYSFVLIAAVTFLSGLACIIFVRNSPEDCGLPSIAAKSSTQRLGLIEGLKQVLRQKKMRPIALFYAFNQAAFLAFVGSWLVPWLNESRGISVMTAANFGMLTVAGIMLGSIASGAISDRLKLRKPVIVVGSIITTAAWGALAFMDSNMTTTAVLLFVMGASTGVFPLSMAVTKEMNPISITGTAIAVLNTVGFFGIAVITSLLGVIADFNISVIGACFIVSMLSTFAAFFVFETHAKNVMA